MTPEFESMLNWVGAPAGTCNCGRSHYAVKSEHLDKEDLATLKERSERSPHSCIPNTDASSISMAIWIGDTYVHGCPCGALDRIEKWVWKQRAAFTDYFRSRSARELRDAQETCKAMNKP